MQYSALIGNPVQHSISPQLFSLIADRLNIEYAHIKIKVLKKEDLLETFKSLNTLGFCGFNITCPYKIDTFGLVDDYGDGAENIKSINCIKFIDGKYVGYNTDGKAAIMSIERIRQITAKDRIVILGAGGAAYSIFYELLKKTDDITIFNRYLDEAKKMVDSIEPNTEYFELSEKEILIQRLKESDIIINATTVGMTPDDSSLILEEDFKKISDSPKIIFDVVFNPWETQMLQIAEKHGHITISGGYMLIYQAILALNLWLDKNIMLSENEIENIKNKLVCLLEESSENDRNN